MHILSIPRRRFIACCALLSAVSLLPAPGIAAEEPLAPSPQNPLALRTYTQTLTLTFDSGELAAAAKVSVAPVYGGKTWAFSGRWDDNHPGNQTMHEHLNKLGMHATYYINATDARNRFGADYARKLIENGDSIGDHTQTHPSLPSLLPDEIFYEILANRVEREAQIDRPINSLAFGFGQYASRSDPEVLKNVSESFVRAGLHNTSYFDFARRNPNLKAFEVSAGVQVVPGDHEIEAEKFTTQLEKTLKGAAFWQKETYLIHLGVHARQQGKAWDDLDALLSKYAHRPDWWYCNMTQYAAYDRQFRNSRIEAQPAQGASRTFVLTRPAAAELGDNVALTLLVEGAGIKSAAADAAPCEIASEPGKAIVNVAHGSRQSNPAQIDVIDNAGNAAVPAADAKLKSSLSAWLVADLEKGQLNLSLKNRGKESISGLWLTLRLPPRYPDGLQRIALKDLSAGEERALAFAMPAPRPAPSLSAGRPYFVAELDFWQDKTPARLFATTRLGHEAKAAACVRDAARVLGPIAEDTAADAALAPLSAATASLKDLGTAANLQWFVSTADRNRYSSDRATAYRDSKEWKTAAAPFDYKPQTFLVVLDFELSEASPLKLTHEAKSVAAFLNGAAAEANKLTGAAGRNRLLLKLNLNDGRTTFMSFPLPLQLSPASGTLTYLIAPQP